MKSLFPFLHEKVLFGALEGLNFGCGHRGVGKYNSSAEYFGQKAGHHHGPRVPKIKSIDS